MLLGRCEFGREDYSLNIVNMPVDNDAPDFVPTGPKEAGKKTEKPDSKKQRKLFEKEDDK
jgi:adenine-specific DNA-methyltransferase